MSDEDVGARVKRLVAEAMQTDRPQDWFEPFYAEAGGDDAHIPWSSGRPNPFLLAYLDGNGQHAGRAVVIGCGLGDDAEALARAGYDVTAFDISPTAIAWCQRRFPDSKVAYVVADLFEPPAGWTFDFVFENLTVQSLPSSVRAQALSSVRRLVAPGGALLLVTMLREDGTVPDGPPWLVSRAELRQLEREGLHVAALEEVNPPEQARRLVVTYRA